MLVASKATRRATHLREAFFGLEPERYDIQFVMQTSERFVTEEVVVYSNYSTECVWLVPLPIRTAVLQLNMRALGPSGQNLVILSTSDLELIYRELFVDAVAYLRRRTDLPMLLAPLVGSDEWEDRIFSGVWAKEAKDRPESDQLALAQFYVTLVQQFPDPPGPMQGATIIFLEYLLGRIFGWYRPWVMLDAPLKPHDPDGENDCENIPIESKILIKYEATEHLMIGTKERIKTALLGFTDIMVRFPFSLQSSSHLRLQAPDGLVLTAPTGPPGGISRYAWTRDQTQFYVGQDEALSVAQAHGGVPALSFPTRLIQAGSMRVIVAATFALLTLAPLAIAWAQYWDEQDDASFTAMAGSIKLENLCPTLALVDSSDVVDAASLALPLVFGLVSLAWNFSAVRIFAVTQLVLGMFIVAAWLASAAIPPLAIVTLLGGLAAVAVNIRGLTVAVGEPPAGQRRS